MKVIPQAIPDVVLLSPQKHGDARGYLCETWRADVLTEQLGRRCDFVQMNESVSRYGVLRGLHFQKPPSAQAKLVGVANGEILDISIDIRQGSPWYGRSVMVRLDSRNKNRLFVPAGFAHGFVVLSETASVNYLMDAYFSAEDSLGIIYNDPALRLDWSIGAADIQPSERDLAWPRLSELPNYFDYLPSG